MKVATQTIIALGRVATGDPIPGQEAAAPYRSGRVLVQFFNEFGANAAYSNGFPSRKTFAEEQIAHLNGTPRLVELIEALFDPRHFIGHFPPVEALVEYVNERLRYDGYELTLVDEFYRVHARTGGGIEVEPRPHTVDPLSHAYIREHVAKCDRKIREGDYDGAVTNARSLVETVLTTLERRLTPTPEQFDGDLPRLFKRVQKLLNLEPSRVDIADHLRTVLAGLSNIVHGIAPLRNAMSDAHVATFRPARHHAKLAVNAAKTLVDFLFDTYEAQVARGLIRPVVVAGNTTQGVS